MINILEAKSQVMPLRILWHMVIHLILGISVLVLLNFYRVQFCDFEHKSTLKANVFFGFMDTLT